MNSIEKPMQEPWEAIGQLAAEPWQARDGVRIAQKPSHFGCHLTLERGR